MMLEINIPNTEKMQGLLERQQELLKELSKNLADIRKESQMIMIGRVECPNQSQTEA
nr:hypothetical protein [uncultured Aminipila sp.]